MLIGLGGRDRVELLARLRVDVLVAAAARHGVV